ncbi:hypothetical protein HGRIS_008660 [Hohenbuehelia grisea]|uniref:Uncharacterized protein n=1 Tax=Hohenbuehelia grisea TaxID=104357 RepID=A0ABR3J8Y2_9AGAR
MSMVSLASALHYRLNSDEKSGDNAQTWVYRPLGLTEPLQRSTNGVVDRPTLTSSSATYIALRFHGTGDAGRKEQNSTIYGAVGFSVPAPTNHQRRNGSVSAGDIAGAFAIASGACTRRGKLAYHLTRAITHRSLAERLFQPVAEDS